MEVGTGRLFVRVIVSPPAVPVGTVMITGDQRFITAGAEVLAGVVTAAGLVAAQVATEPVTSVPQLYPHIGTEVPSGRIAEAGPAVRFTCWATETLAPRRRIQTARTAVFKALR
jgi:hypothetical protein